MEKKLLLDCVLGARQLDEIKVRGGAGVEEFLFRDRESAGLLCGPVVLGPNQRFRLQVTVEPVSHLGPRMQAEQWVANSRERLRSNLERLRAGPGGYLPRELDELAESIDNMINARISRALQIHEDADHDVDD